MYMFLYHVRQCCTCDVLVATSTCSVMFVCVCVCVCVYVRTYTVHVMYMWCSCDDHVTSGASVSVENSEGESPVQIAECTKHSEVIKLLQEAEETGGKSPARNTEGVCVCVACTCTCIYSYVRVHNTCTCYMHSV